jgi:hypothetical protein
MAKTIKKETIHAAGIDIGIYTTDFKNEFISLTDIARYKSIDPRITIHNWLRGRDVVEFLGLWEILHNPDFKRIDFDTFKEDAGTNAFVFSIKNWKDELGAIGLFTKSGRYGGGIYAHIDIAFEFASWISPEFKLYIIKDYQRLKTDENSKFSLNWNLNRELSKINYHIHTDAVKNHLIPENISRKASSFVYANEADVNNVALFGMTAKMWREANPDLSGNIRDYSTLHQLIVLVNLESMNAELIKLGLPQQERAVRLNRMAIEQLSTLEKYRNNRLLE